ncbi:hypothetical protein OIU84_014496 [Salix udensis]|uniref:Nudix hydrolase domain-containing protein n=1 Tax=Salix udensis TaxID=889485 RepID=A0AAD6JD40_9ROSI|nr:hypothetical protein OIU84_014496 [Salix udensis]
MRGPHSSIKAPFPLYPARHCLFIAGVAGRHLQRYKKGRRQVVGCIPYRYTKVKGEDGLQVLVISSQKGKGMLFPKGGWESDETITQAALRETYEEAGVKGVVERQLGEWTFQSRTHGTDYEGYMFPLQVTEVLNLWPEKTNRRRLWMSVTEARECCQHWWMKEALDVLVDRLGGQQQLDEEEVESCSLNYGKSDEEQELGNFVFILVSLS